MHERQSKDLAASGLLQIHVADLLFGLAGLFGKYIALPAPLITLGRVLFAALSLGIILVATGRTFRLRTRRDGVLLPLTGVVLAVHWTAFFQSIQLSTVAVGLVSFATFPVFVTFMEPLVTRQRMQVIDLLLALLTLLGVALVVPSFELADNTTQGVLWGLLGAASFAVLSLLNRHYAQRYSSLVIAFYQDSLAAAVLLPFLLIDPQPITLRDLLLLALLGIVFTALTHTLFIQGLTVVRAYTASIIASLEPVYGIVFAALLLAEIPTWRTLLGGAVILLVVTYASWRHKSSEGADS